MSLAHLNQHLHKDLVSHKYSIFANLKKHEFSSINDNLIVHEAIKVAKQSENIDLLCIFTFSQKINNQQGSSEQQLYSIFNSASEIQKLIKQKKQNGIHYKVIKLQFLAIYDKESLSLKDITDKLSEYNQKSIDHQKINRNLNKKDQDIILQEKQVKPFEQKKTKTQQNIKKNPIQSKGSKQQIKSTKTATLPRVNTKESKNFQQQKPKPATKKAKQPQNIEVGKKLQLQSQSQRQSQSEDVYDPKKTNLFGTSQVNNKYKYQNSKMQIQNQGNCRQNQIICQQKPQKMQIQTDPKCKRLQNTALPQQEDDSDDEIFAQMDKKVAENKKSQQQKQAKTQPVVSAFKNTFTNQPEKKVATKQMTLFGFGVKK